MQSQPDLDRSKFGSNCFMSENSTSVTTSQPQKALQVPRTKQILKRAYHNASGHLAGFNQTNQTDISIRRLKKPIRNPQPRTQPDTQPMDNESCTKVLALSDSILSKHTIQIQKLSVPQNVKEQPSDHKIVDYVYGYSQQIAQYLRINQKKYLCTKNNIISQPASQTDNRRVIVQWMIRVHQKFELSSNTIFLAVNILDRMQKYQSFKKNQLQLLAATSLFISSKYQQVQSPKIYAFVRIGSFAYTKEDMVQMEGRIMLTLQFNLGYISPLLFIDQLCIMYGLLNNLKALAYTISELILMEDQSNLFAPSQIAEGAICLSGNYIDDDLDIKPSQSSQCLNRLKIFVDTLRNIEMSQLTETIHQMNINRLTKKTQIDSTQSITY